MKTRLQGEYQTRADGTLLLVATHVVGMPEQEQSWIERARAQAARNEPPSIVPVSETRGRLWATVLSTTADCTVQHGRVRAATLTTFRLDDGRLAYWKRLDDGRWVPTLMRRDRVLLTAEVSDLPDTDSVLLRRPRFLGPCP